MYLVDSSTHHPPAQERLMKVRWWSCCQVKVKISKYVTVRGYLPVLILLPNENGWCPSCTQWSRVSNKELPRRCLVTSSSSSISMFDLSEIWFICYKNISILSGWLTEKLLLENFEDDILYEFFRVRGFNYVTHPKYGAGGNHRHGTHITLLLLNKW